MKKFFALLMIAGMAMSSHQVFAANDCPQGFHKDKTTGDCVRNENAATPATPATPAVPGESSATPATPAQPSQQSQQ